MTTPVNKVEVVPVSDLKDHPRNYRHHPDDQLTHIIESIKAHGFYRNVVVARDNTILAGHGVVQAVRKMKLDTVPVIRLPLGPDDPLAIKVLTGDNEIGKLADVNDRLLSELLKEVHDQDPTEGLLGTGFDPERLAALVLVTRPASEIADKSTAAAWVGMPEYHEGEEQLKLVISFTCEDDRKRFVEEHQLRIDKYLQTSWSTRWPWTDREDAASVKFEGGGAK